MSMEFEMLCSFNACNNYELLRYIINLQLYLQIKNSYWCSQIRTWHSGKTETNLQKNFQG